MYSISLLPKPAIRVYRECTNIGKVAWFAGYIFGNLLVVVQKRAIDGFGDIGVVYIIGAPHPELLPKNIFQEPLIFDRLNNQAGSKWAVIISDVIYLVFICGKIASSHNILFDIKVVLLKFNFLRQLNYIFVSFIHKAEDTFFFFNF